MISFAYQQSFFNKGYYIMARLNQKAAQSIAGYNGSIAIELSIVDYKNLRFTAKITAGGAPYDVCDDNGKIKVFGNVDNVLAWLKGAYLDVTSVSVSFTSVTGLTKTFVAPTSPLAAATAEKNSFTALKAGLQDNKTAAAARVAQAEASGWNLGTAHPALQANYAELLEQQTAVLAIETYYQSRIDAANAIIALG